MSATAVRLPRPARSLPTGWATGTGRLTAFALRRDRITLPVTAAVLLAMVAITYVSLQSAYGTEADRAALAATVGVNTAFLALLGPLVGTSLAAVTAWRIGLFMMVVLAVVVALAVVRHTRKEEENGRLEPVRAARVGALAPLLAGLSVGVVTTAATSIGIVAIFLAAGAGGTALLVGAQYAGLGLATTGLAGLAAQIATTARAATSTTVALVVAGYAVRGVADVESGLSWAAWTTPVGWVQRIDPFGTASAGPFWACLGLGLVLSGAAVVLSLGRDLGAGLVAPRPGPAGTTGLGSPWALLTRLHGPGIGTWVASAGSYTLLVGLILPSAGELVGTSPQLAAALEALGGSGGISALMVSMVSGFVGIAAGAWTVTTGAALVREETSGRLAQVLAGPVARGRSLGAMAALMAVGAAVIPVSAGLMLGLGHLASGGTGASTLTDPLGAGLVQVPAVLVVAGLVLALYGWAPRWVPLGWALIAWTFVVGMLGTLLDLPSWVVGLSPYDHVPVVPGQTATPGPLVALVAIAVVLGVVGLVGLRRRDLIG
ncbi:MAG: ABC transporter permease [Actinobacteria bacterium]|nr:ABC transporter permease [Actinomycetota bacterium]MCG2802660.1 hypothetical protein [Cellulomonas sp.]